MGRPLLRVQIVNVKAREARRYYVKFQPLPFAGAPEPGTVSHEDVRDAGVRTELCDLSQTPEFQNRSFVMRMALPTNVSADKGPPVLRCTVRDAGKGTAIRRRSELFASPHGAITTSSTDTFMGQADILLQGELIAKLSAGETVAVPVNLGSVNQSQPDEALLNVQLMLLHVAGDSGRGGDGPSSAMCKVLAFISHAEALPDESSFDSLNSNRSMTERAGDQGKSFFVACKTAREAAARMPSKAATRAVAGLSPCWEEVVSADIPETDLDGERLLLGVVNNATQRLVGKAAVALRGMMPGRHYNLKLLLDTSGSVHLTVFIQNGPVTQLNYLRANPNQICIEAGVAAVTPPPGSEHLYPRGVHPLVAVRFYLAADGAAARVAPPSRPVRMWEEAEGNSDSSVLVAAARAAEEPAVDCLPFAAGGLGGKHAWPDNHMSGLMLPFGALREGPDPALVVEFHTPGVMLAEGTAADGAAARSSSVASNGAAQQPQPSPTKRGGDSWGRNASGPPLPTDEVLAATEAEGAAATYGNDRRGTMLCRAVVPLSSLGEAAKWRGEGLSLKDVPLLQGSKPGGKATFVLRLWSAPAWQAAKEAEGTTSLFAGGGVTAAGPGAADVLSALAQDLAEKQSALEAAMRSMSAAENRADSLLWRCDEAQRRAKALEGENEGLRKVLHEQRTGGPQLEGLDELSPAQLKERLLASARREADVAARNAELVTRLQGMHQGALEARATSQRYAQLQDAHAALSKRTLELEAGWDKKTAQVEREKSRCHKMQAAIKTQEEVIRRLETLLEACVQDRRALFKAEAEVGRLQAEAATYRNGERMNPKWEAAVRDREEQMERLRAEMSQMQQAHSEALQRAARQAIPSAAASGGGGGVEKEGPLSQGEALTMRMHAERAEARAEAAHSELREFSKKSAREIAQLKVLLAERDAQLMGTGGGRGSYGSYGRGGAEGAFDGPYDTLLPRQQPQLQGGGGYGMVSPRPAPQDLGARRGGLSPIGSDVHRTGAVRRNTPPLEPLRQPELYEADGGRRGGARDTLGRSTVGAGRGSAFR